MVNDWKLNTVILIKSMNLWTEEKRSLLVSRLETTFFKFSGIELCLGYPSS
jgi:hypothetical protein